jgi:hypothetical protein
MVRVIYNQAGWVHREGTELHVQLQGYADPELQAAVAKACERVTSARIELPSGHHLCMEVASERLKW